MKRPEARDTEKRLVNRRNTRLTGVQLTGFLLWRLGLLVASSVGGYRILRTIFQLIELPTQLEIGLGLVVAGSALFFISLIAERIVAMREEGDLQKDVG